jgi:hypothetical protein
MRGHRDKVVLLSLTSADSRNILGNHQAAAYIATFVQSGGGHYAVLQVTIVPSRYHQLPRDCVRPLTRPTANREVRSQRFAPWKLERECATDDLPILAHESRARQA